LVRLTDLSQLGGVRMRLPSTPSHASQADPDPESESLKSRLVRAPDPAKKDRGGGEGVSI
jgi:hypothetical protein